MTRSRRPSDIFSDVPVDRVREYWDARPCNIRHSPQPVGSPEYFQEVEARKYRVEPHIPRFAEFSRWTGMRVLEIGCGIGSDTMNFARSGARVTAVDLSEESLAIARRRAEVLGLRDSVEFVAGNVEELSDFVAPSPYDLVYAFGVLHHTPSPSRALEAIRLYTRPGSVLKIMVYHRWSWKVLQIIVKEGRLRFWRAGELVAKSSEAQRECPVTYTYSRSEAAGLVRRAGFQVVDLAVHHIFPYKISDYVNHRYARVWYFRTMPDALFSLLERQLGWHICITAVRS